MIEKVIKISNYDCDKQDHIKIFCVDNAILLTKCDNHGIVEDTYILAKNDDLKELESMISICNKENEKIDKSIEKLGNIFGVK